MNKTNNINVVNIQRMIDYMRNVKNDEFDISQYKRYPDSFEIMRNQLSYKEVLTCNSPACVIGHCIVMDIDNVMIDFSDKISSNLYGYDYIFTEWSEKFTGLSSSSTEWEWCFGSEWYSIDNTVEGAISRMEALINGTMESHPQFKYMI